jgi:hypothetical protein
MKRHILCQLKVCKRKYNMSMGWLLADGKDCALAHCARKWMTIIDIDRLIVDVEIYITGKG